MVSNKPDQTAVPFVKIFFCVWMERDNTQYWLKTFEEQTFFFLLELKSLFVFCYRHPCDGIVIMAIFLSWYPVVRDIGLRNPDGTAG